MIDRESLQYLLSTGKAADDGPAVTRDSALGIKYGQRSTASAEIGMHHLGTGTRPTSQQHGSTFPSANVGQSSTLGKRGKAVPGEGVGSKLEHPHTRAATRVQTKTDTVGNKATGKKVTTGTSLRESLRSTTKGAQKIGMGITTGTRVSAKVVTKGSKDARIRNGSGKTSVPTRVDKKEKSAPRGVDKEAKVTDMPRRSGGISVPSESRGIPSTSSRINVPAMDRKLPSTSKGINVPSSDKEITGTSSGINVPSSDRQIPGRGLGINMLSADRQIPSTSTGINVPSDDRKILGRSDSIRVPSASLPSTYKTSSTSATLRTRPTVQLSDYRGHTRHSQGLADGISR